MAGGAGMFRDGLECPSEPAWPGMQHNTHTQREREVKRSTDIH